MLYNPEYEDGWNKECKCPYCGHEGIDYTGASEIKHGASVSYEITEGRCLQCDKKVMIVEVISTELHGTFKGE